MKRAAVFTANVKLLVNDRTQGRCDYCGLTIHTAAQYHHRRPRGLGGTSDPALGSPANCLLLHPACHERIERNRSDSYDNGWLVRSGMDPAKQPVKLWNGWAWLHGDGTLTLGSESEGEACSLPTQIQRDDGPSS